jgi:hypothetical protein
LEESPPGRIAVEGPLQSQPQILLVTEPVFARARKAAIIAYHIQSRFEKRFAEGVWAVSEHGSKCHRFS